MKTETSRTPIGLTAKITLGDEKYVLIAGAGNDERIGFDLAEHTVRIYSDRPWQVHTFSRSGSQRRKKKNNV